MKLLLVFLINSSGNIILRLAFQSIQKILKILNMLPFPVEKERQTVTYTRKKEKKGNFVSSDP